MEQDATHQAEQRTAREQRRPHEDRAAAVPRALLDRLRPGHRRLRQCNQEARGGGSIRATAQQACWLICFHAAGMQELERAAERQASGHEEECHRYRAVYVCTTTRTESP